MNPDEITQLHRKYAPNDEAFTLVYEHCEIVAKIARECGDRYDGKIDVELAVLAAMLHDIGTYTLFIPELHTFKEDGYQQHAFIGAKILEDEGLPPAVVDAVKTHVLMGITADEIRQQKWKLPYADLTPNSIEGELLCYADRFHSKHPRFNQYERFLNGLEAGLPQQAKKFRQAIDKFGLPDIDSLIAHYGHPSV